MRAINSFRSAALGLAILTPLAAGFTLSTPAQAQIEETIWRDQARIAAHTTTTPDQTTQVARGRSTITSDAGPAFAGPARGNAVQLNGAGEPIDPRSGKEASGFTLGGF
jgi:hypothetical protein